MDTLIVINDHVIQASYQIFDILKCVENLFDMVIAILVIGFLVLVGFIFFG